MKSEDRRNGELIDELGECWKLGTISGRWYLNTGIYLDKIWWGILAS